MSADTIALEERAVFGPYPTEGVTVGINHHPSTSGKHRVRLYFPRPVADVLRRGLSFPRLHIDGTIVNGLRIWCDEQDGLAPVLSKAGSWSVSLPVRRLRGRERLVESLATPFSWERGETGPVLIIPRLPDALLPEPVIDKLPNSQVDPATILERAEKRLQREIASLRDEPVTAPEPAEVVPQPPEPETIPEESLPAIEPPSPPAVDLREALAMVNELVDQLGESVVLSIDPRGHVVAKRRIVSFIDL